MTSYEKYRLMDILWAMVIDYSTSVYSLPRVCREVLMRLSSEGYQAEVIKDGHRDSCLIKIDDQQFRIIRNSGWGKYDLVMVE